MFTTTAFPIARSFKMAIRLLPVMAVAHLGLFVNSTASGGCGNDGNGIACETQCLLYDQCCLIANNGDTGIEYCQLTCDGAVCHPAGGGGIVQALKTMCKTVYNNGQCQWDCPNAAASSTGTNAFGDTTTTTVNRYSQCGGIGL